MKLVHVHVQYSIFKTPSVSILTYTLFFCVCVMNCYFYTCHVAHEEQGTCPPVFLIKGLKALTAVLSEWITDKQVQYIIMYYAPVYILALHVLVRVHDVIVCVDSEAAQTGNST